MESAQTLFASATPGGQHVVFVVGDRGACVVKVDGRECHRSDGSGPDAIDGALRAFRRAVDPEWSPVARPVPSR